MKEILITSSVLIGVLMLLRLIFSQKVSRTLIYGAWILVALRLLIPVQIGQLDFSVLTAARPLTETVEEVSGLRVMGQNEREADIQVTKDYIEQDRTVFVPEVQEYIESAIEKNETPEQIATVIIKTQGREEIYVEHVQAQVALQVQEQTDFVSLGQVAKMVWLCGVGVMTLWFAVVNLRHSRSLRKNRQPLETDSPIPVYVSDAASSPCLVGLLRPAVYLTPASVADSKMLEHVVKHELTHYRHGDHLWSLVRCLCLCIYWFDPLVWAAAYLSRRDCELACDEGAMRGMDAAERVSYGKTLLEVVSHAAGPVKLLQTATSMNETGKQLKERVCFIVKKPKISITAAICMVLLCAIVAGCAAAGANTTQPPQNPNTTAPTVPTSSSTADKPSPRIELNKQMNIWYNSPDIHLQCHYLVYKNSFQSGETVSLTLFIKNLGKAIAYTGALEDQIGSIQLWADNGEYVIQADTKPNTDDVTPQEFRHNEEATLVYQFVVPDSAQEDNYTLEITAFGQQIRFDREALVERQYIPRVADLPEEAQRIIAREEYDDPSFAKRSNIVPVYGEFGDVYVTFWHFTPYGHEFSSTTEEVNGLAFQYMNESKIEVCTTEGVYSLTEAFASGLLNEEQIRQVYDNYARVGPQVSDNRPYIMLNPWKTISVLGQRRLYFHNLGNGYQGIYAGEKTQFSLIITNYGKTTSISSITDSIGTTAWLVSEESGHQIQTSGWTMGISEANGEYLQPGESIEILFTFTVTDDIQKGHHYNLMILVDDMELLFDDSRTIFTETNTIVPEVYGSILGQLSEKEIQPIKSHHTHITEFQGHMPLFAYYTRGYMHEKDEHIFVYLYPTGNADETPIVETVCGMEFTYPPGYRIYVVSDKHGCFTLTEAVEAGIIRVTDIPPVHETYSLLQKHFVIP